MLDIFKWFLDVCCGVDDAGYYNEIEVGFKALLTNGLYVAPFFELLETILGVSKKGSADACEYVVPPSGTTSPPPTFFKDLGIASLMR